MDDTLASPTAAPALPQLTLFGLQLVNASQADVLDVLDHAERPECRRPFRIAFVNAHCVNVMAGDRDYAQSLQQADLCLPDGSGMALAARLVGAKLVANLNGTDLFPLLCQRCAGRARSLFLLGGRPGIAQAAGEAMQRRYPGLQLAGCRDGYFGADALPAVIADINDSGADVLLVGFGVPAQDLWLAAHAAALKPRLTLGVGGLFDYYSGRIPRAPQFWRRLGVEWLWRLLQEPRRLARRYLIGNFVFVLRALLNARQYRR